MSEERKYKNTEEQLKQKLENLKQILTILESDMENYEKIIELSINFNFSNSFGSIKLMSVIYANIPILYPNIGSLPWKSSIGSMSNPPALNVLPFSIVLMSKLGTPGYFTSVKQ